MPEQGFIDIIHYFMSNVKYFTFKMPYRQEQKNKNMFALNFKEKVFGSVW